MSYISNSFSRRGYGVYFLLLLSVMLPVCLVPGRALGENAVVDELLANKGALAYNVIAVCLDTLRADHLGCYGYFRDTSPSIDSLAKEGILFEQAFAQSNFTLPSLASLFTSRYVHSHKADRIERRLAVGEITLAGVLKGKGYKTAAFIYNAPQLNPIYGLNQGFETYMFGEERDRRPSFEKTLPQALEWIGLHKNQPFFVFLHANDIHEPYHCPIENFFDPGYKGRLDKERFASDGIFSKEKLTALTPAEIEHIKAHYDAGIRYADGFIGQLLGQLKNWELLDKTILILFSDHGEILADRGVTFCHGFSLHDEEVHVPLIIRHPEMAKGARVKNQVQLIDIMPTLLEFLGIDKGPAHIEGRSLVALMSGTQAKELNTYVYAECLSGESEKEEALNFQAMARSLRWKLISSVWRVKAGAPADMAPKTITLHNFAVVSLPAKDGFQLYDLEKDHKENTNLTGLADKKIEGDLLRKLLIFSDDFAE
jgi:arylsulfatase A-like enzyme